MTFCFTVAGALLAFLWFNAYPAQVFMGDTGALALGATLAVVALMLGQALLLPVVGFVFVAVTLSVILQVGYFKSAAASASSAAPRCTATSKSSAGARYK